ncbi:MAG TPA: FAD-dependent oxidoreductase [Solirubrobacteraceae bacterium]|nr:FAD-dependent oxidoreductase [Solirubrobacteraceae bacterium]
MYDYVIVGAGSAGCVLAARLTEDPAVSVLLLEAGPPDSKETIHVPAAFGALLKTDVDWDYATLPEDGCNGRMMYMPRGKTLGGSSSINAMVYVRGARADYDGWRDLGHDGWGYDDLLPLFKRGEDNERGASEFHGTGGELSVADSRSNNPMADAFVEAALQAGHEANDDFNAAAQDGVGRYQVTQRNGMRCSTAVAFLHPVLERANLTVETRTHVHRVLLEGGRAVGIVGERHGEPVEVRASREVVLAAGAYNSPQLLMLSGIGPADHLVSREIDVAVDLPGVGENLQDHVQVGGIWTTDAPVSLIVGAEPEHQQAFAERGEGPLTSNVAETGGFWRSDPSLPAPDLQFHCAPVMFVDEGLGDPVAHGISFGVCLLTPRSRGTLRLRTGDPGAKPAIRNAFYSDPEDVRVVMQGLRRVYEIARQPALEPYCRELFVGAASDSDADLRAHMARSSQVLYHPVGTCAMGSVVDAQLRVQGVDALRVVDASVMPVVTRGNTNAPTIAIAERAADMIRDGPAREGEPGRALASNP